MRDAGTVVRVGSVKPNRTILLGPIQASEAPLRWRRQFDCEEPELVPFVRAGDIEGRAAADSGHRDHRDRFIVIARIGIVIAESERSDVFGWLGRVPEQVPRAVELGPCPTLRAGDRGAHSASTLVDESADRIASLYVCSTNVGELAAT